MDRILSLYELNYFIELQQYQNSKADLVSDKYQTPRSSSRDLHFLGRSSAAFSGGLQPEELNQSQ